MTSLAVVHLVRHANGMAPFETFMASYDAMPAEREHELVLLFKGFPDPAAKQPYLHRAAAHAPGQVDVDDAGYDLTAYATAAGRLAQDRVCYLNSFSEIIAPAWLRRLDEALNQPGVGAAGATGSWGSHLSYNAFQLGLPGEYAAAFSSRAEVNDTLNQLAGTRSRGAYRRWLSCVRRLSADARRMVPFPAAHLRTNAFIVERQCFTALLSSDIRNKYEAYRFESGRKGMTAQLRGQGLDAVVVTRAGTAVAPPEWHELDVFWQGDQAELLVADNQTRSYTNGTSLQRRVLSTYAWGTRARPN